MVNKKTGFGTFLSWILLFVILCSLGIATYQTYSSIKIQQDMYSRIWDSIKVPTVDATGNEIPATNVIYNMNIYDYTDCVLVNIPVGSDNGYLARYGHGAGRPWAHERAYIKYLKNLDGTLTYDGVICMVHCGINGGHYGIDYHSADSDIAKMFLEKTYEYIFVGEIKGHWMSQCHKNVVIVDNIHEIDSDYLVTFQQQTEESHASGGIFAKMYDLILDEAVKSNITSTTYTKQLLHNTSQLEYIKCFVDGECVKANIYCNYTRTMFTHSLPELNIEWYKSEINGGSY